MKVGGEGNRRRRRRGKVGGALCLWRCRGWGGCGGVPGSEAAEEEEERVDNVEEEKVKEDKVEEKEKDKVEEEEADDDGTPVALRLSPSKQASQPPRLSSLGLS